ncbi:hypothetical protein EIP86_010485 [Pleurotus ostreatoroseus]|nr:hypothetical protein EIP86_010485 [Pleurotus ostreatoroseus]
MSNIRSRIEWFAQLNVANAPHPTEETKFTRKTSIIATIGPKVNTPEKLGELVRAGVNIVRMNFSHGSYEYHQSVIDNTRKMVAANPNGRPVAIALDTKGPEIRTGLMKDNTDIPIKAGHEFIVSVDAKYAEACDDKVLFMDYKNLPKVTAPGKYIYVDDGMYLESTIAEVAPNQFFRKVSLPSWSPRSTARTFTFVR